MPDDFANTMRELAAAAVTQPRSNESLAREVRALSESLQKLESSLTRRIENIAAIVLPAHATEAAAQFKKIDEHLAVIRGTESVNQRLFDSLHEELLKYRDNFLHESLQKPFVRDLIVLFDDLVALAEQMAAAASTAKNKTRLDRWRENLEHGVDALLEILHRLEVTEIDRKEFLDLAVHRVVSVEPAEFAEDDGRIVMRVKRGFLWRGKVLRPEEVIIKRFQ